MIHGTSGHVDDPDETFCGQSLGVSFDQHSQKRYWYMGTNYRTVDGEPYIFTNVHRFAAEPEVTCGACMVAYTMMTFPSRYGSR